MQSGPQRGPDEEGRLHRQPPAAGVYLPVQVQATAGRAYGSPARRSPAQQVELQHDGKPYAKSTLKDWKGYLTVKQG